MIWLCPGLWTASFEEPPWGSTPIDAGRGMYWFVNPDTGQIDIWNQSEHVLWSRTPCGHPNPVWLTKCQLCGNDRFRGVDKPTRIK